MVQFRYIIVNILHKGDNKDDDDNSYTKKFKKAVKDLNFTHQRFSVAG
jgi:hypothetical protein